MVSLYCALADALLLSLHFCQKRILYVVQHWCHSHTGLKKYPPNQCVWFSTFKVNHTVTKHYFLSNIEKWTGSEPEAKFWLKLVGTPCASMFNFASVWSWRYFLRSLCPWERRPFDAIIFPHYFEVYKSLLDSHTHGWSDFHDAAPQMHFFQILS